MDGCGLPVPVHVGNPLLERPVLQPYNAFMTQRGFLEVAGGLTPRGWTVDEKCGRRDSNPHALSSTGT